jgi:prepilin-type N-terminal cleavage/methylation domain-containing protein
MRKGFTLIELMAVVAIVAVLAAIAIPAFSRYLAKGRLAEGYSVIGEIRMKEEAFRAEFGRYHGNTTSETSYFPALLATGEPQKKNSQVGRPAEWTDLGLRIDPNLYCGYGILAGQNVNGYTAPTATPACTNCTQTPPAGGACSNLMGTALGTGVHWFCVRAACDNDGVSTINAQFTAAMSNSTVLLTNEHN